MGDLTALLAATDLDPKTRLNRAFELLYPELRVIAHARLRRHGGGPAGTDTGALVHECWMRLQRAESLQIEHHGAFLALAAAVMRSTIIDLMRQAQAARRGGDVQHVTLGTTLAGQLGDDPDEVLALDEGLDDLARMDARAAQVVEMRFYAGLSEAQVATALGVSERTVRRDWERARAFLALALQR